ncbi:PH domain-containing protein [Herbiconiux sp. SYSU D00978]|uniref:PH domain-containing protein n=1 Tax=Herbiconiux sp. SYSU D00978 TaxID=2812562 RepID=UPI0027DC4692|nr:PH domain-containing protein [Herbiconiux sp. SYSU D00978]
MTEPLPPRSDTQRPEEREGLGSPLTEGRGADLAGPLPAGNPRTEGAGFEAQQPQPLQSLATAPLTTSLADGEWHRLHPATPLLRGGIALIAIVGFLITNLRDRFIEGFLPMYRDEDYSGDPVEFLVGEGLLFWALLATLGVVLVVVFFFWLSWRFHTFRITAEIVEVRQGVLMRTNRRARLDRIQGVHIQRPFFARLFGAAKLEIEQAGDDANVQLSYLRGHEADALRRDVLALASGAQRAAAAAAPAAPNGVPGLVEARVQELLAPELDPAEAAAESVVRITPGRLIGSVLLSSGTLSVLAVLAGLGIVSLVTGEPIAVFGALPALLGLGTYLVNRITSGLRYSVAGTRDGLRVGYGLLSTTNDTLPPGRVHSVQLSQGLLWRPFGWWAIRVNRASRSSTNAQQQQTRSLVLPVGTLDDAVRVLELMLPGFDAATVQRAAAAKGGEPDDPFTNSPRRARVLRWFSRRRNGFALLPDVVALRRGWLWRELVLVPLPRVQSVAIRRGPLLRALRLAGVHVHTVAGPISSAIGALDDADAQRFFDEVATGAVRAAGNDSSHRWRSAEAAS